MIAMKLSRFYCTICTAIYPSLKIFLLKYTYLLIIFYVSHPISQSHVQQKASQCVHKDICHMHHRVRERERERDRERERPLRRPEEGRAKEGEDPPVGAETPEETFRGWPRSWQDIERKSLADCPRNRETDSLTERCKMYKSQVGKLLHHIGFKWTVFPSICFNDLYDWLVQPVTISNCLPINCT